MAKINHPVRSRGYFALLLALTACADGTKFSSQTTTARVIDANSLPADGYTYEQTFSTGGETESLRFAFTVRNDEVVQELGLTGTYSDLDRSYDQVDRRLVTRMYKQGAGGTAIAEQFDQTPTSGLVDILVVVDNSGSMAEEQSNLATKLNPLLSEIANAGWKIGVITTDSRFPTLRAVIEKGQADAATAFRTAVTAGTGGSGNEEGVRQAVNGLASVNPSWLRSNASLAVLFVTDEDNCSSQGSGCGANPWAQPSYLTNYVKDTLKRELGKTARVYGIYWMPGDTTCTTAANQGVQYKQLIDQTGGFGGSICAADYTATLKAISKNISTILKSQFQLKDVPTPGTLVVSVNGVPRTVGFSLTNNILTFTDPPPVGSKIDVNYYVGRQEQLKEFALGETPARDTVAVTVNNAVVDPGSYMLDMANGKVVFMTPPPPSSDVKVVFRVDTPMLKDLDIGRLAVPSSIVVTVNGQATTKYAYDGAAGLLRFDAPPPDLARIRVIFKRLHPILIYDLFTVGAAPRHFSATDKATNQPVRVSFENGKVTVHPDDHADGKIILVRYEGGQSQKREIKLERTPLDGTLRFDVAPPDCALGNGIAVVGDVLTLACDLPDLTRFEGSFERQGEIETSFNAAAVSDPENGIWLVLVNGERRDDFIREGRTIRFETALPAAATVTVRYYPRPTD